MGMIGTVWYCTIRYSTNYSTYYSCSPRNITKHVTTEILSYYTVCYSRYYSFPPCHITNRITQKWLRYYTPHYWKFFSHSPVHIARHLTRCSSLHQPLCFNSCYTLRPMWNEYHTHKKLHQGIILFDIFHAIFLIILLTRFTCAWVFPRFTDSN